MKKYSIGIDLGTTHSVVAYAELGAETPDVQLLSIPQLVAPATVEARDGLPSFLYVTTPEEAGSGAYGLPWEHDPATAVGEWARTQSADVPTRSVAAAKSWLCHSRVDRREPILPWNAPDDVEKISPRDTSRLYLEHLASAWNQAFPEHPLNEQRVVLTVPASFDASARELTRDAALAAGLPQDLVLLEEPQAAVYAWLQDRGESWRKELVEGDVILVCDVGGGTTDFTLVGVDAEDGDLTLRRVAVGNHILVGGDNMDLALAHLARQAFSEKGVEVDAWQAVGLWHACRAAKEQLLAADAPATCPVSVLGRGSKLVGGTISIDVQQPEAVELLEQGFFPQCELDDSPTRRRASGFRELGLPFEADTAVTRHLASFLTVNGDAGAALRPSRVLFNGGVMKSERFQRRIMDVFAHWFGGEHAPGELTANPDLDFAVARGAAFYGFTEEGDGLRIRGGAARSYYVGIETVGLAVPGLERPLQALCVVPHGMEEGSEAEIAYEGAGLVTGEQAHFRFFSSATRRGDRPGDLLSRWSDDELVETDSLETELSPSESGEEDFVPIRFRSRVTELGLLELWSESTTSDEKWKMEFSVRDEA